MIHSRDSHGTETWNEVPASIESAGRALDPFLADLKRREYLDLIEAWSPGPFTGPTLKTDVFEEAMGADALLDDLASGEALAVGIDLSLEIVRRARCRVIGSDLLLVADVRRLPFRDGVFGRVVSPSTLDHFADPDDLSRSLKEVGRVMRRSATLIVTLDNRANVGDPLLRAVKRLGLVPYPLGRSYTVGELRSELDQAGFEVVATTAIVHNPRLVAVGAITAARRLGWVWLERVVERVLVRAQRLREARLRYVTGSFVAALARPREGGSQPPRTEVGRGGRRDST